MRFGENIAMTQSDNTRPRASATVAIAKHVDQVRLAVADVRDAQVNETNAPKADALKPHRG